VLQAAQIKDINTFFTCSCLQAVELPW